MLTPNDLFHTNESLWSSKEDEWLKSSDGQWSLSPQFYSGLFNHGSAWAPLHGLQQPPNSPPVSDLIEYERTKEALELTTEFETLDLNRQYSIPPQGYVCKLCMVKGHWLKNCNLYQERKRENIKTFGPLAMKPQLANRLIANQQITLPIRSTSAPPEGYVCRKCQTPGHWIQQCPLPKHNPPPETYICKICMVKGHWIYQCPQRVPKHHLFPY